MDTSMITHSISNIIQMAKSPKPLSGIDINQLQNINKSIVQKQRHSKDLDSFRLWLQNVKDVVIELNDFIEDLRHKESTTGSSIRLIRSGLSIANRIKSKYQVNKATQELNRLLAEEEPNVEKPEAEEVTNEEKIFAHQMFEKITMVGRENEKKKIIDQMLNLNNNSTTVIAIVGVPGIGKTKLARHVFEDDQVKSCFGLPPIWIKKFDVESIKEGVTNATHGKRLLLVIDDFRIEIENGDDHDELQKKLIEAVGGIDVVILVTTRSNYVANKIGAELVLKLQGLNQDESLSLFKHIRGPIASTSTNKEQDSTGPEPQLEPQSELEPKLKTVRDCGGVPILVEIIATMMKTDDSDDWIEEAVEMLKIIYYDDLPTYQKLCFVYCSLFPEDYLIDADRLIQLWTAEGFLTIPGQQFGRACFDDFVPLVFHPVEEENNNKNKYFGGVVTNNCLFRMNPLMHKLARSVTVGCDENVIVDLMGERVHCGVLRVSFDYSLDLVYGIPDSAFVGSTKLRTILLTYNTNNPRHPQEVKMTTSTCDKIFNAFKNSLRVLDLHDLGINMVPTSIEDAKYLRYLDLSDNNIEKLPSCIKNLIHLQTLKLSQCHVLKELPKDIEDLTCLTHLDIEGCLELTHMPSGINKLTSLQTLPLFVASKKQVSGGLRSLTDLAKLRGHLEISHLEQVKLSPSTEPSKDKSLINKPHLEFLTLRWDHDEEDEEKEESNINKDEQLLECLEPNPNLRVLFVVGYNGYIFSNWVDSLQYLVKFTLNDFPNCEFLPPMDKLAHLKVIQLRRLYSLKFITKNNHVGSSTTPILFFPSLKELTISDCPKLESWWENVIKGNDIPSFSCISKLNVQYCPKLASMPLYPGLDEELVLVDSNVRPMRDTMRFSNNTESTVSSKSQSPPFSKLKSMIIERIKHIPPKEWLKNFISLEELQILDCSNLKSIPQGFESLSSLQTLSIERCEQLDLDHVKCKPDDKSQTESGGVTVTETKTEAETEIETETQTETKTKTETETQTETQTETKTKTETETQTQTEWEGLENLKSLTIRSIPKLTSLPWGVENVKSLKVLRFYDCQGLTSLPESIGNLTSLEKLVLSECRNLGSLPKGMENIKSLQTLIIRDCPLLLPRSQTETGDDWPQIAHIKNIVVNDIPRG